jgi:hypothetical protein
MFYADTEIRCDKLRPRLEAWTCPALIGWPMTRLGTNLKARLRRDLSSRIVLGEYLNATSRAQLLKRLKICLE